MIRRSLFLVLLLLLWAPALAQTGAIRATAYPSMGVADGRSTITVTAEVRTSNGSLAPDGTRVLFSTTGGTFRENIVSTVNGLARGTLIAPTVPGSVKVTLSAITLNTSSTLDLEFVTDRSVLETAKEYFEISSAGTLVYSTEIRTIAGEAPGRKVVLRYRDIVIEASDLQIEVPTTVLVARDARVIWGKQDVQFKELVFRLNRRFGYGTTRLTRPGLRAEPTGRGFRILPPLEVIGLANISAAGVVPRTEVTDINAFTFVDMSELVTLIEAKKIVAYPARDIQFIRANVTVGGVSVRRLPLGQLSSQVSSPIVTDEFLNVTSNQLAIDYPFYLTLRPGETSLLRLRTGARSGNGVGATGGTFLDYELRWNRGDEMDGGLTVGGLGRDDWGINVRQSLQLSDRTSASATLDFPQNRSLFGSLNLSHSLPGAQLSLNANGGRNLRGNRFENQQLFVVAEKDPIKLGVLPMRLYLGATGSYQEFRTNSQNRFQSAMGLRSRFQLNPLQLDRRASLNGSLALSALTGRNVQKGVTTVGNMTLLMSPTSTSSLSLSYDFTEDGFSSQLIGRHRLSLESTWNLRHLTMSLYGSRSLDTDRLNAYADISARFARDWRLGWQYGFDRYSGSQFTDMTMLLTYRLGFREVGLSYSSRTKRLGLELFGTRLDY